MRKIKHMGFSQKTLQSRAHYFLHIKFGDTPINYNFTVCVQHNGEFSAQRSVLAERPIPKGNSGIFYYKVTILEQHSNCRATERTPIPIGAVPVRQHLRIVSQMEGKTDNTRISGRHIFHSKDNDWGFAQFITFKELMDRKNGWYDAKNDTIILSAEMTADEPTGVE
uniref:MATH domain-containing protein n=1 Tax=Globodera rostochiensis TaxID=31243 RepID=A0A914HJ85_GLORO